MHALRTEVAELHSLHHLHSSESKNKNLMVTFDPNKKKMREEKLRAL
jgi:hypothetical protein